MSMSINEYLEALKKELIQKEGQEFFDAAKDVALPVLTDLARAQFLLLSENDSDKKLARKIIELSKESLKDISLALKDTATNYAVEKLEDFVKNVVFDKLLSSLLRS